MNGIGKILRQARESQDISIGEMYKRTHIREWIIEAIEAENFTAIPGGIAYLKGFIHRLCDELGLDYVGLTKSQGQPPQGEATPKTIRKPRPQFNWLSFAGVCLMIMAFLLAAVYWFFWFPRPPAPPPLVTTPPLIIAPPIVQPPPPAVTPIDKPAFVFIGEQAGRSVYAVQTWPMELVIVVREEDCWVMANVDGAGQRSALVRTGETWQATATESLLLRLGKVRVVDIKVNGQLLPRQEGNVKDFTFTKTGP